MHNYCTTAGLVCIICTTLSQKIIISLKRHNLNPITKIHNFFLYFPFSLSLSSLLPLISTLLPSHRCPMLHHSFAVALHSHSVAWRLAMAAAEVVLTQV